MSCLSGSPDVGVGAAGMGVIVVWMAASPTGAWFVGPAGAGEAMTGGAAPAGGWPSWMSVVAGMP